MSQAPAMTLPKAAEHIGIDDVPFVTVSDKVALQLLQVDLTQGLWVLRARFQPGYEIETHRHTRPVFAVTEKGRWFYREYPDVVNAPGSYLFEPAGSVHTLTTPKDQPGETVVWFAVYGANLNLDDKGNITSDLDAPTVLNVCATARSAIAALPSKARTSSGHWICRPVASPMSARQSSVCGASRRRR